jgi:osmotically-inducible protein OsmY
MKIYCLLIAIHLLLVSCSTIGTGGAEVTGLSLLHDRRSSEVIVNDERIEINAGINLNSEEDIRKSSHFNVTSYNGIVLVTGEAPTERIRNKIINSVRVISGVKIIHNELAIAPPSSFLSRTEDTLITTKVKSALSDVKNLPGFDATRVKVITENNSVYLLGILHKKEGLVATEIARRESGVKQVIQIFEYINY